MNARPRTTRVITWLYIIWSIAPVLIAVAFSFNSGKSRSSWQGFSMRWWTGDEGSLLHSEELHRALCEAAGHEIAWSLARRANGHRDRVRRLGLPEPGFLDTLAGEHRAIVAAVAEGDEDRAATTLSRHLRTVLSSVPAIRATHPDYFEDPQKESD